MTNDGMNDEEREALHASIVRGIQDARAERSADADEFITEPEALDAADIDE